ncbi:High-affinitHigh affinity nicotinic acid plasma membrane permease [Komagataella phaffii CBS 7435]|uniref:Vitamin H transporter 1 n=2 Tax=Komagataella phaffii TaxID=460519 RepID=C4QZ79_KOMPG|nr:Vitamin H transporter 1 [Komagataella phaffii GS115]AOA60922.1 GQ67_01440T0 [Komagataella phaffii]CAH2447383.1 High-affinitHigh affinity nicotinic acid plasma membrane permease [Komagataella phaffii CBS 7435]AOA65965.1 GQ68_01456T0 [Komagataella phaffii GS115]CAY68553.1 Vitamin H transporter 1 [Komagataella phaffii GS115]CCA37616.1 High-affinitHigh affinity nicotinic acid plasma membrane permease [Komagataella phaffii CBS 7435]
MAEEPKTRLETSSQDSDSKNFEYDTEVVVAGDDTPTTKQLDKVYRHLDYRIIPALWCLYFLTSFGSSAYGNTLTMNAETGHSLIQTLNLTTHDTSTASALYYVGYIIFDVPMNLAMTRVSPQMWLSRIVITVGLVYTCYSAATNSGGIIALRFISGTCGAGTWPGLSYYVTLWYPNDRSARRIGYYFTAAQMSAAAAGLVAAGFQKINMNGGREGWKWMYITYGCITMAVGISLIWWLPDRPTNIDKEAPDNWHSRFFTSPKPLTEQERSMHRKDLSAKYTKIDWGLKDVVRIFCDFRIWPLVMMYFGVVGAGFGLAVFGTTIIRANNPGLSSINVSLLYAPIWLFDLAGILLITPIADRFKKYRPVFFSCSCVIIIVGLMVMTYADDSWSRYGGLLICGFGLGPTVPITMAWTAEIFGRRHGDVGCAVSAALVSGLGNLGSVVCTYALYSGWPEDRARLYKYSNMMLVLIVGVSIVSSFACVLLQYFLGDYSEPKEVTLNEEDTK